METEVYCDPGFSPNECTVGEGINFFQECYHSPWWDVKTFGVVTDTPSNTWCRAPGSTQVHVIGFAIVIKISNKILIGFVCFQFHALMEIIMVSDFVHLFVKVTFMI